MAQYKDNLLGEANSFLEVLEQVSRLAPLDKPVLVIRNTLDYVVTPKTSLECAKAYKNSQVITVKTDNYHGYEMSYPDSALKEELMCAITEHFAAALRAPAQNRPQRAA